MNDLKFKIITFANDSHKDCRDTLVEELKKVGFNEIITYNDKDLPRVFLEENYKIFSYKRGFGYWIWKPFLLNKTLEESNENEIIIYIDSTDLPKENFINFINEHFISNDILLFNNLRHESHDAWTKRDCFVLMGCDDEKYHNRVQLEAGVIGLKKTNFNLQLLKEWLFYCKNVNIVSDEPNICGKPNYHGFIEHRHDQSILTNLFIKYDLPSVDSSNDLIEYNYHGLQRMIKRNK